MRDLTAGTTTRVSVASDGTPANGASDTPKISGNGRYVAFASDADNLTAGDGNHRTDVFVHDLQTGITELVSQRASDGPQGGTSTAPAINRDGRYVAFKSTSINLVPSDTNGGSDVFLRDRTNRTITARERRRLGRAGEARQRLAVDQRRRQGDRVRLARRRSHGARPQRRHRRVRP